MGISSRINLKFPAVYTSGLKKITIVQDLICRTGISFLYYSYNADVFFFSLLVLQQDALVSC